MFQASVLILGGDDITYKLLRERRNPRIGGSIDHSSQVHLWSLLFFSSLLSSVQMVTRGRKYFMLSQPTKLLRNFSIKRRKNGDDFKCVNVKESLVAAPWVGYLKLQEQLWLHFHMNISCLNPTFPQQDTSAKHLNMTRSKLQLCLTLSYPVRQSLDTNLIKLNSVRQSRQPQFRCSAATCSSRMSPATCRVFLASTRINFHSREKALPACLGLTT